MKQSGSYAHELTTGHPLFTGMLLEMENQELLLLLEDAQALQAKVDEAITVLKQHNITAEGESAVATTEA